MVEGQRQPVKFLEKTLSEYFHIFKQEIATVKMGHTSFENLQPKNIKLKSQARRQVCCCIQHVNIDYLRTKLNELLRINNQPIIPDNEILVSKTVCGSDDITCIERLCKNCSVDLLNEVSDTISIVLMTAKRNKKNAATTLFCATNLEKLIIQTKEVKLKRN